MSRDPVHQSDAVPLCAGGAIQAGVSIVILEIKDEQMFNIQVII